MKKLIVVSLAAVLVAISAAAASAAHLPPGTSPLASGEVDGSFAFASGPGSFDAGFGFNLGAGFTLRDVDKNLQGRVDFSVYQFDRDFFFNGRSERLSYTRIPITFSARYYLPIVDRLWAFAQAGLETSLDNFEYIANGNKQSKSEVNIGVSPGGGVEFFLKKNFSVFAVGRAHLISDSYVSMQFGAASHF